MGGTHTGPVTDTVSPYQRWTRRTERPLLVLALLFLVVLCIPVIDPDLPRAADSALRGADYAIWITFVADYLVRLRLAPDRARFVRTHVPDLLVVVLPALRPLRLLRLLTIAQLLARRSSAAIVTDVTRLVAGAAVLLVFLASVAVLDAERHARGANITTFGDAVWWACTTITTVGYGDRYPVTGEGRALAVALMIAGLALLAVFTAAVAAWFVRSVSRDRQIETAVLVEAAELDELRERLAAIEQVLRGAR